MAKSSHSLLHNFALTALSQVAGKGLRYLVASLVIRQMGESAWGEISYALTVVTYLLFVLDLGICPLSTVHHPDSKSDDQQFFHFLVPWRLGLSLLLALAIGIVLWFSAPVNWVLLVYLLAMPLRSLAMEWWFQRKGFHGQYQLITVSRQVLIVGLLALGYIKTPAEFAAWDMVGEALTAVLAWIFGPRLPFKPWHAPSNQMPWLKSVFHSSLLLFVSTLFIMIHQNVAILVLKHLTDYAQVGIYDYSSKMVLAFFMLGAGFSIPLRRQMGRMSKNDLQRTQTLISSVQGALLMMSVSFTALSLFVIPHFFGWVMPLESAQSASAVLSILSLYIAISFMSVPLSEWLFSQSSKWPYFWLALQAGLVNLICNLILVPLWGVQGAAWATVIAEAGILIRLWILARKGIQYQAWPLLLALMITNGFFWLLKINQAPVWSVALVFMMITAVLWKTGILSKQLIQNLRNH